MKSDLDLDLSSIEDADSRSSAAIDLAPGIHRQRMVIEGYPSRVITSQDIEQYLSELSHALDMKTILHPVTHRSEEFGWAGWIHWETSGAHFYAWEVPLLFFSVDIYTCKPFEPEDALKFTAAFFDTSKIQGSEF